MVSPKSKASVLKEREKDIQRYRNYIKMEAGMQSLLPKPRNTRIHQKLGERKKYFPLELLEGVKLCPHL